MSWLRRLKQSLLSDAETVRRREQAKRMILAGHRVEALFEPGFRPETTGVQRRRRACLEPSGEFRVWDMSQSDLQLFHKKRAQEEQGSGWDPTAVPGVEPVSTGGIITVSVNIGRQAGTVLERMDDWLQSTLRRVLESRRAQDAARAVRRVVPENVGWSIGNLFRGHYVDKAGNEFDERSFSVDIAGVSGRELQQIAESLRQAFGQESVLVYDRQANAAYFKYASPTEESEGIGGIP